MRCGILIAAVITLVAAKPELYREKEDFQFSRSSSDEGSKSGYYGAQRGNMGGNYERAHNMDHLAQHQMSGLVHQVQGELGDGSKMRTGSVYTAANSRGIYGSGQYDLSNLQGRNFQEGASYGDTHSQSSLSNSAYSEHSDSNRYNNRYRQSSRHSSSQQSEHFGEETQSINSQDENLRYQNSNAYTGSSGMNHAYYPQNSLIDTRPMKVVVRPGTRVTLPVATQTYNAGHSGTSYDATTFNQNAAKTDAELIINADHESSSENFNKNRRYESSYRYRKEWEKHDTSPGVAPLNIPTENSLPQRSELYDDSVAAHTYDNKKHRYHAGELLSQNVQSSNAYGYNSNNHAALSSQSKYQTNYDAQQEASSLASNARTNLNKAHNTDYTSGLQQSESRPKSYQSSYSYHKSWEHQGDPYVIVPVPTNSQNGQTSRLTAGSNVNEDYTSHHYGSHSKQARQSYFSGTKAMDGDCDEGNIRVARSYDTNTPYFDYQQKQKLEEFQRGWENIDQQSHGQWDESEGLGQQIQNQWEKIEDLGQQTYDPWEKNYEVGQQSKLNKIENLDQQTQNSWDNAENIGQQIQNQWDKIDNIDQQKISDLGQQTQDKWDKIENEQTQNSNSHQSHDSWDKIETLAQQSQLTWDKIQNLHAQNNINYEHHDGTQSQNQLELFEQQSKSNTGQQQDIWNKLNRSDIQKHELQSQNENSNIESQSQDSFDKFLQPSQTKQNEIFQIKNKDDKGAVDDINNLVNNKKNDQETEKESKNYRHIWDKIDDYGNLQNRKQLKNTQETINTNIGMDTNAANNVQDSNLSFKNQNTQYYDQTQQNSNNLNSNFNITRELNGLQKADIPSVNNIWNKIDQFEWPASSDINPNDKAQSDYNKNNVQDFDNNPNNIFSHTTSTTVNPKHEHMFVSNPRDVGRGDIESEESVVDLISTTKEANHGRFKTPEEIEALSLSKEDTVSKVDKYNDKRNKANDFHSSQDNSNVPVEVYTPNKSDTLNNIPNALDFNTKTINNSDQNTEDKNFNEFQINSTYFTNERNDFLPVIPLGIESKKAEEITQSIKKMEIEQGPTEMDQQSQFSQQSLDFDEQNLAQWEDFVQQQNYLNQQQMDQQFEKLEPHSYNPQNSHANQQEFLNFDQVRNRQGPIEMGQKSLLSQQNIDFGQQQNMEQWGDSDQQQEYRNQQQMEQQFEKFEPRSYIPQSSHSQLQELNWQTRNKINTEDSNQPFDLVANQILDQHFKTDNNFNNPKMHKNNQITPNRVDFHKVERKLSEQEKERNTNQDPQTIEEFSQQETNLNQFNHSNPEFNEENQNQQTHHSKNQSFDTSNEENKEQSVLNKESDIYVMTTPAPVSEKSGFWSSLGSKFSRAKEKVSSWFRGGSDS